VRPSSPPNRQLEYSDATIEHLAVQDPPRAPPALGALRRPCHVSTARARSSGAATCSLAGCWFRPS